MKSLGGLLSLYALAWLVSLGIATVFLWPDPDQALPAILLATGLLFALIAFTTVRWLKPLQDSLNSRIQGLEVTLEERSKGLALHQGQLALVLDSISEAVIAVGAQDEELFSNAHFKSLFKSSPDVPVKLWEIFREPRVLSAFRQVLHEKEPSQSEVIPLVTRSGKREFELRVYPLTFGGPPNPAQGKPYGALGSFYDVTELRATEQMKADFVANVSHELRTPVTVIKGYVDTLIDDHASGRKIDPQFLEALNKSVQRMKDLVMDLLDLSALDSRDSKDSPKDLIRPQTVETASFTRTVLSRLEKRLSAKNQQVELDAAAPQIEADPLKLEQVLTNLVENASKYSPVGSKITIRWYRQSDFTVLSVRDEGPGIAPEHHERVFERFYRVDPSRSRDEGGTGLGLAIVKHIVQSHGGAVQLRSEPGKGSEFLCYFPKPKASVQGA